MTHRYLVGPVTADFADQNLHRQREAGECLVFGHAGAELSPAKQTQLKAMNKRLSTLQTDFSQKLLAAAKAGALHVTDKAALAGLSDQQVAAAFQAEVEGVT